MDPLEKIDYKFKVIYIFGRGHSGTTIIDLCVARALGGFSGGEIISGLRRVSDRSLCACGSFLNECDIWGDVHRRIECEGYSVKKFISKSYNITNFFNPNINRSLINDFDNILFSELSVRVPNRILIDSSKELYRGYCLALNKNIDVDFIFVTRNGLSVLASYRSRLLTNGTVNFLRKKRKIPLILLKFVSAIVLPILVFGGQTFASAVYVLMNLFTARQIRHINYDKLLDMKTDADFKKLKEELAFDVGADRHDATYHPISGNQIIWQKNYDVSFKKPKVEKQNCGFLDKFLYLLIAFPHIILRVMS
mgnify:CR=1 FL=1